MSAGYTQGTAGVARDLESVFGSDAERIRASVREGQAAVNLGILVSDEAGVSWEELQLRAEQPIAAQEILDSLDE